MIGHRVLDIVEMGRWFKDRRRDEGGREEKVKRTEK